MKANLEELIKDLEISGAEPTLKAIRQIEEYLQIAFPSDYVEFVLKYNGAEGAVGASYVAMWAVDEIVPLNRAYSVEEFAPGIVLFASDGGGEAYGFDTRDKNMPIVNMPFIGMGHDAVVKIADTFHEFLLSLNSKE